MSKLPTLLVFRSRDGANNVDPFNEDVSGGDVGRCSLAWLKVYRDDDDSGRPLLEAKPDNASRFLIELPEVDPAETDEDDRESAKLKKAA